MVESLLSVRNLGKTYPNGVTSSEECEFRSSKREFLVVVLVNWCGVRENQLCYAA